ncbi:MAG: hypothetical protein ABFS45_05310 [Pseudomonadota bacterium]
MEQQAKVTLTETHRFWLDHLKRCGELKQPMAVYAKANGLIVTTLYYWNKRLRALGVLPEDQATVSFTAVKIAEPPRPAGGCRVHFPNGVVMQWDEPPQGAELEQVMQMLVRQR